MTRPNQIRIVSGLGSLVSLEKIDSTSHVATVAKLFYILALMFPAISP